MNPLARKFVLTVYISIAGAICVNYLMGLGWLGRYDKIAMLGLVAFGVLFGGWQKSRAEKKARGGEVVVEALDAQGAVRSDPRGRRFIFQTVSIVVGMTICVVLAQAYRDRSHGELVTNAVVAVIILIVAAGVCWNRFGNISEIEGDDGVTLTVRRRGQTMRVPWRQVESVEVSRPYQFWQVMLKFRLLGESKSQTIRFLPLGWRKMTAAAAGQLESALGARRMVQ